MSDVTDVDKARAREPFISCSMNYDNSQYANETVTSSTNCLDESTNHTSDTNEEDEDSVSYERDKVYLTGTDDLMETLPKMGNNCKDLIEYNNHHQSISPMSDIENKENCIIPFKKEAVSPVMDSSDNSSKQSFSENIDHIKSEDDIKFSDKVCDSTCNISNVNIDLDIKIHKKSEASLNCGLLNSNVNNNNINISSTQNDIPVKPKKASPIETLDYDRLKGKRGIELLTAIEEQSTINIISDKYSDSGDVCSPRKSRTRSMDVASTPQAGIKRSHSVDVNDSEAKLRKIEFSDCESKNQTPVKSEKKKDEKYKDRKSKKHESKSKGLKKKNVTTQTKIREQVHINNVHDKDEIKPRILTNGNYSYPPDDVSDNIFIKFFAVFYSNLIIIIIEKYTIIIIKKMKFFINLIIKYKKLA